MQSGIKTGDLVRLRWESAFTDDERAMIGTVLKVRGNTATIMWTPGARVLEEGFSDVEAVDETW